MKKIFVLVIIFIMLVPCLLYSRDNDKEVRLRPVWVLISDRNNDADSIVKLGFVKEKRDINYINEQCMTEQGCHDISSQDKGYKNCIRFCTVYAEDWKIIKILNYEKKPFNPDWVIWNIKSR